MIMTRCIALSALLLVIVGYAFAHYDPSLTPSTHQLIHDLENEVEDLKEDQEFEDREDTEQEIKDTITDTVSTVPVFGGPAASGGKVIDRVLIQRIPSCRNCNAIGVQPYAHKNTCSAPHSWWNCRYNQDWLHGTCCPGGYTWSFSEERCVRSSTNYADEYDASGQSSSSSSSGSNGGYSGDYSANGNQGMQGSGQ